MSSSMDTTEGHQLSHMVSLPSLPSLTALQWIADQTFGAMCRVGKKAKMDFVIPDSIYGIPFGYSSGSGFNALARPP